MVFFSLLELLLFLLFLQIYQNIKKDYHKELLHNMQICSYSLTCNKYRVNFAPKHQKNLNRLYFDKDNINAFFYIPKSKKFDMSLGYSIDEYNEDISTIFTKIVFEFIAITLLLLVVSIFFTLYTLQPIRKALKLNDEFIKDILHDFNTPIASMVLNIQMFNRAKGEDPFIKRISQSLNTILLLQDNLKTFLYNSPSQINLVDINTLVQERIKVISSLYPKIKFDYCEVSKFSTITNRDLLIRIIDNLLTNAAKYNRPNGLISLVIDRYNIKIKDTGKGIKDIDKVLQRYYKEQDRGLGLGLHIVQKLTQELNIKLKIKTELNKGTEVSLLFQKVEESL